MENMNRAKLLKGYFLFGVPVMVIVLIFVGVHNFKQGGLAGEAVLQGDRMYKNQDWKGALESYKKAENIQSNSDTTRKIEHTQKMISWEKAAESESLKDLKALDAELQKADPRSYPAAAELEDEVRQKIQGMSNQ